jgi:hypothetical protein
MSFQIITTILARNEKNKSANVIIILYNKPRL